MGKWPSNPTDGFQNNVDHMLICLTLILKVLIHGMPLLVQYPLLNSYRVGGPVVMIEIVERVKILPLHLMACEQ